MWSSNEFVLVEHKRKYCLNFNDLANKMGLLKSRPLLHYAVFSDGGQR